MSQGSPERQVFYGIAGAVFFLNQMLRAVLRQRMAGALLVRQRPQMKWTKVADVLFFWGWSILLLLFIISSAFRRTITWRGIKYKMVSLTETTMLASEAEDGGE